MKIIEVSGNPISGRYANGLRLADGRGVVGAYIHIEDTNDSADIPMYKFITEYNKFAETHILQSGYIMVKYYDWEYNEFRTKWYKNPDCSSYIGFSEESIAVDFGTVIAPLVKNARISFRVISEKNGDDPLSAEPYVYIEKVEFFNTPERSGHDENQ